MLYNKKDLENALFFHIETKEREYATLSTFEKDVWAKRFHDRFKNQVTSTSKVGPLEIDTYEQCAKYIAEFSTIAAISAGVFGKDGGAGASDKIDGTEKDIIDGIATIMNNAYGNILSGWNIINYQVPYLIKKFLVHEVKLPFLLQIKDKKPWEINMNDVMRDYQGNLFGEIDLRLAFQHLHGLPPGFDNDIDVVMAIMKKLVK